MPDTTPPLPGISTPSSAAALRLILKACDAWDNDEPFTDPRDPERPFNCDADFITYVMETAEAGL